MNHRTKIYDFLTILIMALFCYYTYSSMRSLGFEELVESSRGIISLSVVAISLLTIFFSHSSVQTSFVKLWWAWIVWLLIDFFVLGLRGQGVSNYFFVSFAPLTFLFFYTVSSNSMKTTKIATIGFLILFVIAFFLCVIYLSTVRMVNVGEEIGVSNLVYWCLCAVPFIFLIKNKWVMLAFIVATTIIILLTGKRSANICLLLIIISFLLHFRKQGGSNRNIIILIIGGIALLFIVYHYFSYAVEGVMERMRSIEDTQGSGRVPLYRDVFKVIETNTFFDWIFGRGFGSILITGHTNAHNDALQMIFEYGLIGLIFYLLILWKAIKATICLYKHHSLYYMGYLVSLIIFVVLGMVSNLVVFYSYFAFICAYWGIAENEISRYKYLRKNG